MKITFLGTGTSHGVPLVGCNCSTCTSNDPRDRRYRSAIYIQLSDLSILIDTPPELRLQLLENKIRKIDAVLFTHPHADHLMGFDDLRAINRLQKEEIYCYGNKMTINRIENIFDYIFNQIQLGGGIPEVILRKVDASFRINNTSVIPLPVKHGKLDIFGYKIGELAYITDCSFIPKETFSLLSDIKVLIIDALRYRPHPTHMNIEEALEVVDRLNVDRAYFTHLSHDLKHQKVNNELPSYVQLAYDGLQLEI